MSASERLMIALKAAQRLAVESGHEEVNTAHMLAAILRDPHSIGTGTLRDMIKAVVEEQLPADFVSADGFMTLAVFHMQGRPREVLIPVDDLTKRIKEKGDGE